MASAQIAARSMHDYLRGTRTDVVVRRHWVPAAYTMARGLGAVRTRESAGHREPRGGRRSVDIVEENLPEAEAREQASRCLRCNINTVFDTEHVRRLQRLRGRLSGEPDPAGRPERCSDGTAVAGSAEVRPETLGGGGCRRESWAP